MERRVAETAEKLWGASDGFVQMNTSVLNIYNEPDMISSFHYIWAMQCIFCNFNHKSHKRHSRTRLSTQISITHLAISIIDK